MNRDADAETAYQQAWRLGEHSPEARQRLTTLTRAHGDAAALARLVRNLFSETGNVSDLLEVGRAQLDAGEWEALGQTLALASREESGRFAGDAAYWSLQAEWLTHQGDRAGAVEAWARAFMRAPSPQAAADYLWSALALDKKDALARAVKRVSSLQLGDASESREPLAMALVELGRPREALRLWALDIRSANFSEDAAASMTEALASTGRVEAAARLRARSRRRILATGGQVDLETPEGQRRFDAVADAWGAARGADAEARWMRAVLARIKPSTPTARRASVQAKLLDLEGRGGDARVLWRRASVDPTLKATARDRMLQLALEENDRPFLRSALARPDGYPNAALAEAALRLDDAGAARAVLHNTATPDASVEHQAQLGALAALEERQAARLSLGGTYESVSSLVTYGPSAAASVFRNGLRYGLEAKEGELTTSGPGPGLAEATHEGEVLASVIASGGWAGAFSELAAGVCDHTAGLLPRARATHERWMGSRLLLTLRAGLAEQVDDAPILRALGAATSGLVATNFEASWFYGSLAVKLRDDRTRRYDHLATELSEEAEAGVRLLRGGPELDVGVRAFSQQRDNVAQLPENVTLYWPDPSFTAQDDLPPSYTYVAAVARLAHGDLSARHALGGGAWPRYECGAEAGVRLQKREVALGGQCLLGLRVGSHGELTGSALYGWGLFALSGSTSSRFTLAYNQRF